MSLDEFCEDPDEILCKSIGEPAMTPLEYTIMVEPKRKHKQNLTSY